MPTIGMFIAEKAVQGKDASSQWSQLKIYTEWNDTVL